MYKFNKGDKVYLVKRGIFGTNSRDWTLGIETFYRLEKNKLYTVLSTGDNTIKLEGCILSYHKDHFKKYE